MVVTTVLVSVKPQNVTDFISATIKNHDSSIRESGNRRFDILQSNEDPTKFLLYEAYDTEEDAAAHKKTAHYAEWRDTVAGWMAEPRRGIGYRAVKP